MKGHGCKHEGKLQMNEGKCIFPYCFYVESNNLKQLINVIFFFIFTFLMSVLVSKDILVRKVYFVNYQNIIVLIN